MTDDSPVRFETQADWVAWLAKHHASSSGIWLQIARKDSRAQSVSYPEALDAALCYGWIDGQKKAGPDGVFLQRFTARRGKSIWSKVNRTKALALIEARRMQPAGFAAIENAKQNGCWEAAYDGQSTATIPEDLAAALGKNTRARAFFATLSSQNRYAILFRLQTAKKAETRAKRLETFVRMLENHETIHPS